MTMDTKALLAEAEARVHGTTPEEVHFHEVGAVDSIIDIAGAAICLEMLRVDAVFTGPVELGSGTVTCQHGTMPFLRRQRLCWRNISGPP